MGEKRQKASDYWHILHNRTYKFPANRDLGPRSRYESDFKNFCSYKVKYPARFYKWLRGKGWKNKARIARESMKVHGKARYYR
jgi:hypothetical protein